MTTRRAQAASSRDHLMRLEGGPQYELDGNLVADTPKSQSGPTHRLDKMRSRDPTRRKRARTIHQLIHHIHRHGLERCQIFGMKT